VTHKARRVRSFSFYVSRAGRRLFVGLVAIGATRALAQFELRTIVRIVYGYYAKISGKDLPMSLVGKLIYKIACLRVRENAGPKRLVIARDAPRLVADTAEADRLTERGLEELSRKVVTPDAYSVGEVLGHRLIGVLSLLLGREMAIGALNFHVFFQLVRKATAAGSVFGFLD
jgi:hypothetical protein